MLRIPTLPGGKSSPPAGDSSPTYPCHSQMPPYLRFDKVREKETRIKPSQEMKVD